MPLLETRGLLRRTQRELGAGSHFSAITSDFRRIELIATEAGAVQRGKSPQPDTPLQPGVVINLLFRRTLRVIPIPAERKAAPGQFETHLK